MSGVADPGRSPVTNPVLRGALVVAGLVLTVLGIAGFALPGLPGTPLLLVSAWLFSMSNDRLYTWMVTNRWFGQAIADYRAGLGIPRRAKVMSVSMVLVVISISVGIALDALWLRVLVAALGAFGILFILTRPTREVVASEM